MSRTAIIVAGLGFGDEGKGTTIDFLARRMSAHTVVRYNGGAQAAHNVITGGGRHHTFAQFGSGAFVPGVRTHLSRHMLIQPLAMINESKHLIELGVDDIWQRTSVHKKAVVITPFHRAANRLREWLRGQSRHGSCGIGVGEAKVDFLNHGDRVLLAEDLHSSEFILRKLDFIRALHQQEFEQYAYLFLADDAIRPEWEVLCDKGLANTMVQIYREFVALVNIVGDDFEKQIFDRDGVILFEGAQGVLLDEVHGFQPHTTWSDVTFRNAEQMLVLHGYDGVVKRLGIMRVHTTRHGAGPLPTEDLNLTETISELHNGTGRWQGDFRFGWFDSMLMKYACEVVGGVDGIVLTCADMLPLDGSVSVCVDYLLNDGSHLKEIVHTDNPTFEQQEQLTKLLYEATPVYAQVSFDVTPAEEFAAFIEEQLGKPIIVISSGATAEDKTFRVSTNLGGALFLWKNFR